MNEDLHSEDEQFKKAYEGMEEDPSPEVWEKINAGLDNIDAVYYRSQFVTWKRVACLLLLLLGIAVSYQLFTSEEKKTASTNTPSKTASDSLPEASLQEQSRGKQTADQQAGVPVFTDTLKTLQNDKHDSEAAGEMPDRHHYQQSLPAKNITEDKNAFSSFQSEAPVGEANVTSTSTKPRKTWFSSQRKQARNSFDSTFNDEIQTTELLTNDIEKRESELVMIDRSNQVNQPILQIDSARVALLSVDSSGKEMNALSASNKKTTKLHKSAASSWTVTPFVSADFTGYELDDDDDERGGSGQPEHHKQEIEEREVHQFSYSTGALARWQFSPKLYLKTGLIYSNIAIGIQPQTLYATTDNNQSISYKFVTSSGYAYVKPVFSSTPASGDSITSEIAHHHLQFLSVPFTLSYKFNGSKRLSFTPGIGLTANLLLSTKIKTELNEDTDREMVVISKLQGLRKTYFSFMADADINYYINKHISLSLLPMFKYAANSITKGNVVKTFPYSLSIGAGVTYGF